MSDAPPSRRVPPALVAAVVVLGGCSIVLGGRPEACGVYPAGGGPAVVSTRDQELCEVVRLRVFRRLDRTAEVPSEKLAGLVERSLSWERKATVDELIAAIRKDAGDGVADEVERAVRSVAAQSKRPLAADCADEEKCLVKGAARGARLAMLAARPAEPPVGRE